jgi:DNA-binding XRE family transcriptional regulator
MKIYFKEDKLPEITETLMKSGLTQRGFAKTIGVSGPYISQIFTGNRNPGPAIAKKICDSLKYKFDDIFFIQNGYKSEQNKSA